jgi:hypothetical protein
MEGTRVALKKKKEQTKDRFKSFHTQIRFWNALECVVKTYSDLMCGFQSKGGACEGTLPRRMNGAWGNYLGTVNVSNVGSSFQNSPMLLMLLMALNPYSFRPFEARSKSKCKAGNMHRLAIPQRSNLKKKRAYIYGTPTKGPLFGLLSFLLILSQTGAERAGQEVPLRTLAVRPIGLGDRLFGSIGGIILYENFMLKTDYQIAWEAQHLSSGL